MNTGLMPHQQQGHDEVGPRFKVSSERPDKLGSDHVTSGLIVCHVIRYTTSTPIWRIKM